MGSNSKGSNQIDLDLSLKYSSYVPKTIACIFTEIEKIDRVNLRLAYLSDYLEKYKEELSRVNTIKRQLPESMLFLVKAIEVMKENIIRTKINDGQDMHDRIRVEEFFRWRKNIYENELKNIISSSFSPSSFSSISGLHVADKPCRCKRKEIEDCRDETSDHYTLKYGNNIPINDNDELDRRISKNPKTASNRFSPQTSLIKELSEEINADPFWKGHSRRTWTPQLHRLFLLAVEKLGGPYDTSPKQIRDCMQIDGLTNDHIKSHLQKHRIHQKIRDQTTKKVNNNSNLHDQANSTCSKYMFPVFPNNQHQQISNRNSFSEENAYIPQPPKEDHDNFDYVNVAWLNHLRNDGF